MKEEGNRERGAGRRKKTLHIQIIGVKSGRGKLENTVKLTQADLKGPVIFI